MRNPSSIIELISQLRADNVPDSEFKVHVDRYLEMKARRHFVPLTGSFELTPLCNLNCKMCYVHLDESQFSARELLSVDTWKSLMQSAHNAGMLTATLTGGECLTYPGFDELYLFLYNMGIRVGVLTNGVLIDDARVDFFVRYPPRIVRITLYGSSDDVYERVTGHRCYSLVRSHLIMLRDAGVPIQVSITPNAYMRSDTIALLESVAELSIPFRINANLIAPRMNTGRGVNDLSIDEYVEIFKAQSTMFSSLKKPVPVDPTELPEVNTEGVREYGLVCGAGSSSFGILHDGSMCPCLSLGEIITKPLEVGFKAAWKQINKIAKSYPRPIECGGCIYSDRCLHCIAMHKNAPRPGHCDPRICERTQKFTEAGFILKPVAKDK